MAAFVLCWKFWSVVLSLPYFTKPAYLLILAQKLMDLLVPLFNGKHFTFRQSCRNSDHKCSCGDTVEKISKSSSQTPAGEMGNAYTVSPQYSNL